MLKHKHHIIPKHQGGSDDPSNLVELTVEEHALAHKLLYEQYGKWEDKLAWKALAGQIGKDEIIQEARGAANRGRKRTPEQIERMKESAKKRNERWKSDPEFMEKINKKRSETLKKFIKDNPDTRANSLANLNWTGRTHSAETKQKLREHNLGKKLSKETIQKRIDTINAKRTIEDSALISKE
jgi:hypothetical protein